MKTLILSVLTMILSPLVMASQGRLFSVTLVDQERTFSAELIEAIRLDQQKKIDQIELKNGEIFYGTEIQKGTLLLEGNRKQDVSADELRLKRGTFRAASSGGDGSGGG